MARCCRIPLWRGALGVGEVPFIHSDLKNESKLKKILFVLIILFLLGCQPGIKSELVGRWTGVTKEGQPITIIFKSNKELNIQVADEIGQGIYNINGSSNPYDLDIDFGGRGKVATIITINGNSLTIEENDTDKARPLSFSEKSVVFTRK